MKSKTVLPKPAAFSSNQKNNRATPPKKSTLSKANSPSADMAAKMRVGAALVAGGQTLTAAAKLLCLNWAYFSQCRNQFPDLWQQEIERALAAAQKPPSHETGEVIKRAVALIAAGGSINAAARTLGMQPRRLHKIKELLKKEWGDEFSVAKAQLVAIGYQFPKGPPEKTQEKIRNARALAAAGLTKLEIAKKMGVDLGTIDHWRDSYANTWQEEYARAMEAAVIMVRSQVGTDAVLDDPAEFIRRAYVCDRWTREKGEILLPVRDSSTVSSFYATYYKPVRLADSAPPTPVQYEGTIRIWAWLTGDPPLKDITVEMLARFKSCLQKMRGKKRVGYMSANTVRKHLRHLQTLLDKAGPPGPRNRDAAGVIPGPVAWIKPPRSEEKLPKIITMEMLGDVYMAAVAMDVPRLPGFKPAAWWRALLAVAFNTQLRHRTLFEMRMDEIDWAHCQLDLPPARLKSHRSQSIHLNEVAMRHLLSIRTDRELVFQWPHSRKQFDRCFYRLQAAAGIPLKDQFGLHDIRRTAASAIWADSPAAAQYALGHRSIETTRAHYVNGTSIVARALDALPQPSAFSENSEMKPAEQIGAGTDGNQEAGMGDIIAAFRRLMASGTSREELEACIRRADPTSSPIGTLDAQSTPKATASRRARAVA
jgi:integrase